MTTFDDSFPLVTEATGSTVRITGISGYTSYVFVEDRFVSVSVRSGWQRHLTAEQLTQEVLTSIQITQVTIRSQQPVAHEDYEPRFLPDDVAELAWDKTREALDVLSEIQRRRDAGTLIPDTREIPEAPAGVSVWARAEERDGLDDLVVDAAWLRDSPVQTVSTRLTDTIVAALANPASATVEVADPVVRRFRQLITEANTIMEESR